LNYISSNAVTNDDFYIVLGGDETASNVNLSYSGKTVGITLLGYGYAITLNASAIMFTIRSQVTLTLGENITLNGSSSNSNPLIYISGGNLVINDDAKIRGNDAINGGGAFISSGAVTMNGGEISGCTASNGGGVYVYSGRFTMNGGLISGNGSTATSRGGGVYISSGGNFTINGGEINGNTASNGGQDVYVAGGVITINGGTISGIQFN
jgi:hypothetical protein